MPISILVQKNGFYRETTNNQTLSYYNRLKISLLATAYLEKIYFILVASFHGINPRTVERNNRMRFENIFTFVRNSSVFEKLHQRLFPFNIKTQVDIDNAGT